MDRYGKGGALPLYSSGNSKPATKVRPAPVMSLGLSRQFEVSGYMMLASLIFWICIFIGIYTGVSYLRMYHSFDDAKLEEVGCCTNFGGTIQDNRNFIETYAKGEAGPYLMRLGPETFTNTFKGTPAPSELEVIPPIVTAVSSADFYNVQSLIRQWREEIKGMTKGTKLIIFDIGLYSSELELITKHCDCEVRTFRTSAYPPHVADISNFAYRPVIIQTIIEEFGSVMWLDPNMLVTRASDLNQLKYRGSRDFFLWQPDEFFGTIAFTNPAMFEYLKEPRCCYVESCMMDTSVMVFYRTNTTWLDIMKPWLKCALNVACIAPPKSRYSGCFESRSPKETGCHRYDQSALSIILERMHKFTFRKDTFQVTRVTRAQDEYLSYFPEQPWTYTEMMFVSAVPLTCIGGLVFMYMRRKPVGKSQFRKR